MHLALTLTLLSLSAAPLRPLSSKADAGSRPSKAFDAGAPAVLPGAGLRLADDDVAPPPELDAGVSAAATADSGLAPPADNTEADAGPTLRVEHLPVAEVQAGADVVLKAEAIPPWQLGELVVFHRRSGEQAFRRATFERSAEGHYVASIPTEDTRRTPVEYYLAARQVDGALSNRFASAETPHPVLVHLDEDAEEKNLLLAMEDYRRSRVGVFAEYVDYGQVKTPSLTYPDRYYRGEIDFRYLLYERLLFARVEHIRIGMGRMRGTTPYDLTLRDSLAKAPNQTGIDYGFSEVAWSFHPLFGGSTRMLLGGNDIGFSAGVGGKIRIGAEDGSRVELEGEVAGGIGASGAFRLAWNTVPKVPMSATVQLTNVPAGPVGMRFIYKADWQATDVFSIGAQVGYQARRAVGGGISFGLSSGVSW